MQNNSFYNLKNFIPIPRWVITKFLHLGVLNVQRCKIDKKDIISYFIKDSITKILKSNYVHNVIETISNNLTLLILEEIYKTCEINKKLTTIIE